MVQWRFSSSIALIFFFLCLIINTSSVNAQKLKGTKLIERVADLKQLKKLLRIKTNVLVLFINGDETSTDGRPIQQMLSLLAETADRTYGKGILAVVNCLADEGKKICKKLKVTLKPSTESYQLKHFDRGEFHQDYNRPLTVSSMTRFLEDPTAEASWDEDETSADIVHLQNEADLKRQLNRDPSPTLVMFYAPWCAHCKRLRPDFMAAAEKLRGKTVFGLIDATRPENAQLRQVYKVAGFPTLVYFENGRYRFHYNGGTGGKEQIISWLAEPSAAEERGRANDNDDGNEKTAKLFEDESDVVHLTDDTFEQFIGENPSVLVMFYAPWCGHCKQMKPDYVEAARILQTESDVAAAVLSAVDATENAKLTKRFDIKGFPTLKYFRNGAFAWDFRDRSTEKIVKFMQDPKEPPAPPPQPDDVPWSEQSSDIVHLNLDNFKQELKKKKHALVMFYAPWCGHCKRAKPFFSEAASDLKNDFKVALGAVDCTANEHLCTEYKIVGYPTFIYFSYLKTQIPYTAGQDTGSFVHFIQRQGGGVKIAEETAAPLDTDQFVFDSAVKIATAKNFDQLIAENSQKQPILIMFYSRCDHCKQAKVVFAQAAATNIKSSYLTVDCTVEKELCKMHEVIDYPTIKIYENGQFKDYMGKRTKDDFVAFSQHAKTKAPETTEQLFKFTPAVKVANEENFQALVEVMDSKPTLAMFYAPWCGHCKKAKPNFDEAANANTDAHFVAIDCTAHRVVCNNYAVKGYPTFKIFRNGKFAQDYKGKRTKEDFEDFPRALSTREEL